LRSSTTAKKPGRPTVRAPDLGARICSLLADGMSLRAICEMPNMPNRDTVRLWLADDAQFSAQYARAREMQAETFVDEGIEIVDRDDLKPEDKRIRFDARRWYASKVLPRKYGDKLELTTVTDFGQRLIQARERVHSMRQTKARSRKPR
jgi:hypothetical protein